MKPVWLVPLIIGVLLGFLAPASAESNTTRQPAAIVSRIPRQAVPSTAIATVGYSKRLRALEIEFVNGATYRYLDVPRVVYRNFMVADSKARFYHRHIRGKYRSVHVRPRRK
jgi:hypothetical protein